MIDIKDKINQKFGAKYSNLKLLSVVYDTDILQCSITFLYPYNDADMSSDDKKEIESFLTELLSLNGELKIKYKKSYLDEKLISADIIEFFRQNKKGIFPYISPENISSSHQDLNVKIKISLNGDVLALIDELELKSQLKSYLDKLYIANFDIEISQNEDKLPDEIEADDVMPVLTKAKRYDVNIEKKIVGGDIIPKPEYISDNKNKKDSVILSGVMTNKTQKKFIIKKGKHAGEEKALYSFNLKDSTGSIECVYFCSRTHEKDLDALEDMSFLLCVGDIRTGLTGKNTYYVRKISLASPLQTEVKQPEQIDPLANHKQVVFPDILPRNTQENLFDVKSDYNDFIMKNKIVVFDIETTGLDPETCEITEIGAVKVEYGEITERFASFAKPKSPIPADVQALTNITNEMVAHAPQIEDVIIDFYEWTRDCIISGYNVIGFDLKFVKKVGNRLGLMFDNTVIDTMIVVRQSKLRTSNYKLGTVVKALGLTLNDAHRAFNDAYATAQVLMELNKNKK